MKYDWSNIPEWVIGAIWHPEKIYKGKYEHENVTLPAAIVWLGPNEHQYYDDPTFEKRP